MLDSRPVRAGGWRVVTACALHRAAVLAPLISVHGGLLLPPWRRPTTGKRTVITLSQLLAHRTLLLTSAEVWFQRLRMRLPNINALASAVLTLLLVNDGEGSWPLMLASCSLLSPFGLCCLRIQAQNLVQAEALVQQFDSAHAAAVRRVGNTSSLQELRSIESEHVTR